MQQGLCVSFPTGPFLQIDIYLRYLDQWSAMDVILHFSLYRGYKFVPQHNAFSLGYGNGIQVSHWLASTFTTYISAGIWK